MTGIQVVGWAGISAVSIVIVGFGAAVARIFWQAADTREGSIHILGGKK